MRNCWTLLIAGTLATYACTDAVGPRAAAAPLDVPASIVIPGLGAAGGGSSHDLVPDPNDPNNMIDVPPEYLQAGLLDHLLTSISADADGGMVGVAMMSFYATDASQTMTLEAWRDGGKVGSKDFSDASGWAVPQIGSLTTNGTIPTPSCGATLLGNTQHSASIGWAGRKFWSATRGTSGVPISQLGCATQTSTSSTSTTTTSGGGPVTDGSGSGGTVLYICETTDYYSASGWYLYSERSCRFEQNMT